LINKYLINQTKAESNSMKKLIFSLLFVIAHVNIAVAAPGDIAAGKGKAAMCSACHGASGISAAESYPNLAGQHADYITKQLKAFKSGDRKDPVMAPMAAGLSEQDMADVAAYFASLPRKAVTATAGDATSATAAVQAPVKYVANAIAGKSLYELGDESRSIGACSGCHGKDGNSKVLIYPNLAKQHAQYIEKQLHAFKDNSRTNFAMNQFAGAMTDEEISDIGAYFSDTKAVANVKARRVKSAAPVTEAVIAGKAKSAVCAACHGAEGNSLVPMYPNLAGQSADYLTKQLKEFKNGIRKNAVMAGMVATLSEQDMVEISAYYSTQKENVGTGDGSAIGRKLYFNGNAAKGITACVACHGVNGKGMPKAGFPAIASQNSAYLTAQLNNFKSMTRENDRNGMMRNIAKKLKKNDVEELVKFMSTMK
jgi:cytochrome c553